MAEVKYLNAKQSKEVSNTPNKTSKASSYLKDNRSKSGFQPQSNGNGVATNIGTVQCVFKRGKNFLWLDTDTNKVYKQIEVQIDNRVKLRGDGETFFIYSSKGKWNRKGAPKLLDESYEQSKDRTVTPFLKAGRKFMGERGAKSQALGKNPPESHVRELAVEHDQLEGNKGAGLHEFIPTNYRGKVAKSGDEAMRALQSGARSSTALTSFRRIADKSDKRKIGKREVGLHTGFASSPSKRKGQAGAHNEMRAIFNIILKAQSAKEAVNIVLLKHLEVSATGRDILNSEYITGVTPHLKGIGKIEPVADKHGPNRLLLAQVVHTVREGVKRRTRSLKRTDKSKRSRSPSPPRRRIKANGLGGGYVSNPTINREVESIPKFVGEKGSFEKIANMASWASQPQRLGNPLEEVDESKEDL